MLFYRVQVYGPGDLCSSLTPRIASTLKKYKTFCDFLNSSTASFQAQLEFSYPQAKSQNLDYLCYPEGFRLYRLEEEDIDSKAPRSFPFVATSEEGSRCYVTCLKFYEKLPSDIVAALKGTFYKIVDDGNEMIKPECDELPDLYYQKSICILSRMPFFTFAR